MAKNLGERAFASLVTAITYCFYSYNKQPPQHHGHHHHHGHKSVRFNINHNMTKGRPLSLQAGEQRRPRKVVKEFLGQVGSIHVHPNDTKRRCYKGGNKRHTCFQTIELKVRMCCAGCERVVKHAIHKLRGIDSVEVDLEMEKVTVTGYVDRNKVLKAVRRAGKRAEFWPYQPLYFTSTSNYFKDYTNEYKESYNYWRHGYNVGDRHGIIHATHRGDDKVSNMFNDDNVNACSVM